MKILTLVLLVLITQILLFSCEGSYTPKPKGFNRIDLPEQSYTQLPDSLPYQFQVSEAVTLEKHRSPMAERYWIDLKYYGYGAEIQLTYKELKNDPILLNDLVNDAYKLTSKHQIKAYSIEQINLDLGPAGMASVFDLAGDVPSQVQFFATDSTENFLRGALYFKTSTKNDSLAPVIDFVREDIITMLKTLKWD